MLQDFADMVYVEKVNLTPVFAPQEPFQVHIQVKQGYSFSAGLIKLDLIVNYSVCTMNFIVSTLQVEVIPNDEQRNYYTSNNPINNSINFGE